MIKFCDELEDKELFTNSKAILVVNQSKEIEGAGVYLRSGDPVLTFDWVFDYRLIASEILTQNFASRLMRFPSLEPELDL